MVKRNKNLRKKILRRYAASLVVTFLLFLLGVSLGVIIDQERVKWSEKQARINEIKYESSQIQYLLLSELEENKNECTVLQKALEKNIAELAENLEKMLEYEKNSYINKQEYSTLKRKYLLSNLKYWLLSKKVVKVCPNYDVVNVLYFYSTEKCKICPDQGVVLTYFKKLLDEKLLVFPIDIDLKKEEPTIELLMVKYNITKLPSLVINEKKYEGIIYKKDLGRIICKEYKRTPVVCEGYT